MEEPQPVTESSGPFLAPQERVLSTLNRDGSRRWLYPKPSTGRWMTARKITAWALILFFTALPFIEIGGKPSVLLDIPNRHFTFFGTTFFATDMVLLMLLLVGLILAVFIFSALWGRVWCGWACPQTVYMEFLFRPFERLIEGGHQRRHLRTRWGRTWRLIVKYLVFLLFAMYLTHTFLAYFVGVDALRTWVTGSPTDHPVAFAVMAITTALMLFDFAYFREQTCTVVCPYGRFQAVLLDRQSLIVGYDLLRGEPRGKGKRNGSEATAALGDCIDCFACVHTCPTGIDIRDGLQMECVHCTQCMDACDTIMDRIGKPRGLVRYTSQAELEGAGRRRLMRWRAVLYPVLLAAVATGFIVVLAMRTSAEVTVLRGIGSPYTLAPGGQVTNQIRIKVANRSSKAGRFAIALEGAGTAKLIAPQNPLPVKADSSATTSVFILLPRSAFTDGSKTVRFRVSDQRGFVTTKSYRLLGPFGREAGGKQGG